VDRAKEWIAVDRDGRARPWIAARSRRRREWIAARRRREWIAPRVDRGPSIRGLRQNRAPAKTVDVYTKIL
jgi:hypothetical protein